MKYVSFIIIREICELYYSSVLNLRVFSALELARADGVLAKAVGEWAAEVGPDGSGAELRHTFTVPP